MIDPDTDELWRCECDGRVFHLHVIETIWIILHIPIEFTPVRKSETNNVRNVQCSNWNPNDIYPSSSLIHSHLWRKPLCDIVNGNHFTLHVNRQFNKMTEKTRVLSFKWHSTNNTNCDICIHKQNTHFSCDVFDLLRIDTYISLNEITKREWSQNTSISLSEKLFIYLSFHLSIVQLEMKISFSQNK